MANPFIGEIRMFGGNFAPANWAFCQGQLLSINEYETLYALIGTTYGGDGVNTFALPNLQSRLPLHQGSDGSGNTYSLGANGGVESVTLTSNQLGGHTHPFQVSNVATQPGPGGAYPAVSDTSFYADTPGSLTALASNAIAPAAAGNQPHENRMPFLAVNYIISLFGIFPSQS